MQDIIETKDLYIASLWYAKGLKMIDMRRNGKQCWFIFSDKEKGDEMEKKYWSKEIQVNAKDYADALRTLKGLLFSK